MGTKKGLLSLIDRMAKAMGSGFQADQDLEDEFRTMAMEKPGFDEELAALLPTLIPRTAREEARINVAIGLLSCLVEELRIDMERGRKGAAERMAALQESLAAHVFGEEGDANLCAAVGRVLLEGRVEILPAIHEANRRRMLSAPAFQGEGGSIDMDTYLSEGLREAGCTNPFEALDLVLEQTGLMEPQYQAAMAGQMLASGQEKLRELGVLMLFHPLAEVRAATAAALARAEGVEISPETLRRLIIMRNWFPPEIRSELDSAIANARRAKVECAPLKGYPLHSVSATTIDGAGAQSFWFSAGEKKRFDLCNILWKQGAGVIDTFTHRLPSAKGVERFMEGLPDAMCFAEVDPAYVDKVIGHALAVGAARGGAPHRGLLQIAELIGADRWRAEVLIPEHELAAMGEELAGGGTDLPAAGTVPEALQESSEWPAWEGFADTWFEDDETVDRVVQAAMKGKGRNREEKAVAAILAEVLEPRRGVWLERLVLMVLWLKCQKSPPVPWPRMYHVAAAMADGRPLRDIPLMRAIAEITCGAALERCGS
ncbi:MAG TPA: hypothetical protein VMJ66_14725 [Geobacteraceae bacterium]|nr:hypothetical protein [Geobacteraceae bacterium]